MCGIDDIFKTVQGYTMSKTIRNERTKGFLDKLQNERKTRKMIRCLKADDMVCNIEDDIVQEFE